MGARHQHRALRDPAGRLDLADGARHGAGRVLSNPDVRKIRAEVERQVKAGELTPALAAQQILKAAAG